MKGKIYWLTGQPGSGKTTIGKELNKRIPNSIYIDGEEVRKSTDNNSFTGIGRRENMKNAMIICSFLASKGFTVIVGMVSPYRSLRDSFKSENDLIEVYLHTDEIRGKEKYFVENYEEPICEFLDLDTGVNSINDCVLRILG